MSDIKQGVGGKPTIVKTDYTMRSDMDAFTAAWNVLKATLPIKPETMQWETDPRRHRKYKQTGGVARRGRKKMMDDFQGRIDDTPLDEGEYDIMDQHGYRGRDREYGDSYKTFRFPDLYDKPYYHDNAVLHPSVRSLNREE